MTRYIHDPVGLGNVVGEYDPAGSLKARYTHGMGLVSRMAAGGTDMDYYTFDPLGNTSEVSGAASTLQNRYAYRPFGETILAQQTVATPFRFMGEFGVMAAPAGLTYVRARHYDAWIGRFTAMDPIGFHGGDNNLYRYALNSPTDGVDPSGLWTRQSCARLRGGFDLAGGVAYTAIGLSLIYGGALTSVTGVGAPVGTPTAMAGAGIAGWGLLNAVYGGAAIATGHQLPRFSQLWVWLLHQAGPSVGLSRSNIETLESAKNIWDYVTLGHWSDVVAKLIEELGGGDVYCPYNRSPVSSFGACSVLRSSQSVSRTPQDIGTTRQPLSSSSCMPFEPVIFGDAGLAASHDPNQKLGPAGFGDRNFMRTDSILSYHIDFENLESATAPAQIVFIRDRLSEHLDPTTFELVRIGFGDVLVTVPPGLKHFETVVDYAYTDEDHDFRIEVHIEAWLDNGVFHANFISIDPETGLPPQDVGTGFLPPENETGRGQGFISYMIKAGPEVPGGTEIRNIADIQFDSGLTIATNQVDPEDDPSQGTDPEKEALVSIDGIAPASRVAPIPEMLSAREFRISWSGEDDEQGSGLAAYEIYVSVNGGPFTHWLTTTGTSAVFSGECGHQYSFYSLAVDHVGNVQEPPSPPHVTFEIPAVMGDTDGSGEVDLADLVLVLQGLSRTGDVHLGANICADVDGDGRIGMAEAVYILHVLSDR